MITETTAISCAAFGALVTPLGISAGIGWIRCARMLDVAAKRAWEWHDRAEHLAADLSEQKDITGIWRDAAEQRLDIVADVAQQRDDAIARATDLEDRLRQIEQARHASAKHARAAQIAQRKAAITATTNQLQREVAERAPKLRRAA